MIIDFHTHVFPDKVAAKALPKLAAGSGGMEPVYDATVDGLESFLSKNGIDKAVALSKKVLTTLLFRFLKVTE